MFTLIYSLLIVVLVGIFVTFYRFIKFLASFTSLIFATNQTAAEQPWDQMLTGGFLSMFRVLRHKGNARARNTLLMSTVFFLISFALTMGAGLLLFQLNAKHCVLRMTETSWDGVEIVLCDPSD